VALVTGSSRGIGAAIARRFAQEGAMVAVHGRDRAALATVAAEIDPVGYNVRQVTGDVTKFADLEAIRADIERATAASAVAHPAQKASLVDRHPIRRLGTPDDVARAALFLASDESAWITGLIVDVAGGAVMV
jgi:NAD(P)-dependent dehydrogenase (short-subunit alcohol dehydrogenase family)